MTDTAALELAEKAALTAGVDLWHTAAIERLGVPSLCLTDGPNGARGERWSSGASACLPCGSALGATWNRGLVRRVGRVLADEAHAKGAQVLLAPTVNIHRYPLGGRHFECYSEDPYLTAELACAYIEGVQERGVGAVIKHFVCNDQEHERHTIDIEVDERALREIYLPPFEAAVRRSGVWAVMGAYNRVGGTFCCEHAGLLLGLLKTEWGFDGLVMSDWHGTHSTGAVAAGLDLEMPGPAKHLGAKVIDAVRNGQVPEGAVDQAAERLLRLIQRVGASRNGALRTESASAVAREAAREAIVLLRNERGSLPLAADGLKKVAVIGPMARHPGAQGGGSAEVTPTYVVSPLDALAQRLGAGVELVHEQGCTLPGLLPVLDQSMCSPFRVEFFDNPEFDGQPVANEEYAHSRMFWSAIPTSGVPGGPFSARMRTTFVPEQSGTWRFGLGSAGQSRLLLDGAVLVDNFDPQPGQTFFGRGSTQRTAEIQLEGGRQYRLDADFRQASANIMGGIRIGAERQLPADAIQRAAEAAAGADVAIVVAGYDGRWESESFDRPDMHLPGRQDELIRAVAAANPRTIVVLNAGAPVSMDWAEDVPAILQLWFPGQECGNALADVLFGDHEPTGRLPTSFPRRLEDNPAHPFYPGADGKMRYGEGVFVGYRHYDRQAIAPRFCFGHGLSYTSFGYANAHAAVRGDEVSVSVEVTNTGPRAGTEVVQVYVRDIASSVERPDKELREFAKLRLEPGQTTTASFVLPERAFAYWDVQRHAWTSEAGEFDILIGSSSRDIRATVRVARSG